MHSDSSLSLYPSLPLSLSSPTPVPPPSSSATFLRLQSPNHPRLLLFLSSSPYLAGASVLLRFWILHQNQKNFSKPKLIICNQKDLKFDPNKSAVVFNVSHGVSVKLVGSVNVFVMHSASNRKIWVFAVKLVDGDDDGVSIKLMRCAAIDYSVPVFSISVLFGFLILGEDNGVRVFPLRPLVKGRAKGRHYRRGSKILNGGLDNGNQRLSLRNGGLKETNGSDAFHGISFVSSNGKVRGGGGCSSSANAENSYLEEKIDRHSGSVKLRSVKVGQDSREAGWFVAFKSKEVESFNSKKLPFKSAKAVSIQVLSPNKFLVLDSVGDLHLLLLSGPLLGSEVLCHMKHLTLTMKVQKLAVLPDISTRAQTVWISDGHYTVHAMVLSDMDTSGIESDMKDNEGKLVQTSGFQSYKLCEKVQDIIPFAADAVLILGQVERIPGSAFDFKQYLILRNHLDGCCRWSESWEEWSLSSRLYSCLHELHEELVENA
ncbi:hypothetical protein RJ639_033873 [Escallonia herrerae]|uniref:Uncharacterized protein n=1 Tax=Escallonia herrerae TaxID=1293975 RepID=A0AA88WYB5_9ASTE|nr:hypothetical protein RJ639_033873 [Escallonia herrerae]